MSSRQGVVEMHQQREKITTKIMSLLLWPNHLNAAMCGVTEEGPLCPVFQRACLQRIMERSRGLRVDDQMS